MKTVGAVIWLCVIGLVTVIPALFGAWGDIPMFLVVGAMFAAAAYMHAHYMRLRDEDLDAEWFEEHEAARLERIRGAYQLAPVIIEDDEPEPEPDDDEPVNRDPWRCRVRRVADGLWRDTAISLSILRGKVVAPYLPRHAAPVDEPTELLPAVPDTQPVEPEPVVDEPTTGTSIVVPRDKPEDPHDEWRFTTQEFRVAWDSFFDEEAANVRA